MNFLGYFNFFLMTVAASKSNLTNPKALNCNIRSIRDYGNFSSCVIISQIKIAKQNYSVSIKANQNITFDGITLANQRILFLPKLSKNLTSEFRVLFVINSSLYQITSNDLKNYPSLEVLDLSENLLIYLEKNLLKYNKKLKYFDISSNAIVAIHSSVFDSLLNLSYFNILYNECASLNRFPNQKAITNGMNNLKKQCMNDNNFHLNQVYNTIEKNNCRNSNLITKNKKELSKMSDFENPTIIVLGCIIIALIVYIIYKNCRNSSNQRFQSKVYDKSDMIEETSSICFSSTAGGLDGYPIRSNFNTLNRNLNDQSTYAEDGLPENLINEYAEPVMFTKQDVEGRQQNSKIYANSDVNPLQVTQNYHNCGQLSDGSDVRYQNFYLGQSCNNLGVAANNSILDVKDVGKLKQSDGQRSNSSKRTASVENIEQSNNAPVYTNSSININQKPSQSINSSQNTMTHSINDLNPTKHPESSAYDSSTQKSVKIAEIGKKTVKYTNISRAPSKTEDAYQNVPSSQPTEPKILSQTIQTPPINQQVSSIAYSTQSSTSSTGSIRRPKNLPNLQKPKLYDSINQKLQVITPRDTKPFEFPGSKSPGFVGQNQKDSLRSSQKKKTSGSSKTTFKSVGVHQSPTEGGKSPDYTNMGQKPFALPLPSLPENIHKSPDAIQNFSNSGTFAPKTSTSFSLNLHENEGQLSKSPKTPDRKDAPKLPNRNKMSSSSTLNRESIYVDYIEPLLEPQLYSEPYEPKQNL